MTEPEMPEEIYLAGRSSHVYAPDDVFSVNYDGAISARNAWECTRYIRADKSDEKDREIERLRGELLKMRKIAAHVPGLTYIKAKEAAGYASHVVTKSTGDCPDCVGRGVDPEKWVKQSGVDLPCDTCGGSGLKNG